MNWFRRHWNGNLSLAKSFWVNTVLFAFPIATLLPIVFRTFHKSTLFRGESYALSGPRVLAAIFCMGISLFLVVWSARGVCISSRTALRQNRRFGPLLTLLSTTILLCVPLFFCQIVMAEEARIYYRALFSSSVQNEFLAFHKNEFQSFQNSGFESPIFSPNTPDLEKRDASSDADLIKKPVIYLYPLRELDVRVRLAFQGELTTTYPTYDPVVQGWNVRAYPDGRLINKADGNVYYYLFWEGRPSTENFDLSTGFVVSGKDSEAFLRKTLSHLGLTPKEYNDFIVYWLPRLQKNPYNVIHFAEESYERMAALDIEPKPETVLRVFMVFKPINEPISLPEQKLPHHERKGFTVVEWGGTEIGE